MKTTQSVLFFLFISAIIFSGCIPPAADEDTATLPNEIFRVVSYNISNNPDNTEEEEYLTTIFSAIKNFNNQGITSRPHIIALQETDSSSAATVNNLMNELFAVDSYELITSGSVGGDRTALIYDDSRFEYLDAIEIVDDSLTRPVLRVKLSPTNSSELLYIYIIHLKSGSTTADIAAREAEAQIIAADANSLLDGGKLFLGDFNWRGASEGAWAEFMTIAFDPLNAAGEWRDNPSYKELHTQDPQSAMNDRFDLQLMSPEMADNLGIEWVNGAYTVLGNNGSHTLNAALDSGDGASSDVLNALMQASDHLPVVADFSY